MYTQSLTLVFNVYFFIEALNALQNDQYLTHHWAISNSQMIDYVGNANMVQGSATTFTTDRFGHANEALSLNGGWTTLPSGVYFNTPQFTISVWVWPNAISGQYSRVIDIGNPGPTFEIELTINSANGDRKPSMWIYYASPSSSYFGFSTNTQLALNTWQFLAATYDGLTMRIYIDGVASGTYPYTYTMPSMTRSACFVGKNPWNQGSSSSYLDDLRFYNKSLSLCEINDLMKNTCKYFFLSHSLKHFRCCTLLSFCSLRTKIQYCLVA